MELYDLRENNRFPQILAFDSLGNTYLGGSLELIKTKDLNLFVYVVDPYGNRLTSRGGGWEGDAYCKGIDAKSSRSFIVAENTQRFNGSDYQIILTKYIEPKNNLHFPRYMIFILSFIGLCIVSIIGLIYLEIKRRDIKSST